MESINNSGVLETASTIYPIGTVYIDPTTKNRCIVRGPLKYHGTRYTNNMGKVCVQELISDGYGGAVMENGTWAVRDNQHEKDLNMIRELINKD